MSEAAVFVIIPALDEEESLPLVLAELPQQILRRIIVVDNGSSDRTGEVALAGGAEVVREEWRGYGRACQAGIRELFSSADSSPRERDVVVFLDADHSDYPEELPLVIAPILAGDAELVIGSRILGGASMEALLPQAWFGNRLACFLMRTLFGARHTDLGPFRSIRVDALQHLQMGDNDYGWTVEMQLKARVAGLRVVEVPVTYRERIGVSKITGTVRGTIGAAWKILGWIFGWRVRLWLNPLCIPRFPQSPRSEST
ncbi:MAG: glycosyltransferase involved in cell wall biosynthesis [Planctomycetota bacterium]